MSAYQAVIFDMDGLLLDTERVSRRAWKKATAELGHELDDALYLRLIGSTGSVIIDILEEAFETKLPLPSFTERLDEIYFASLFRDGIDVMPGVEALLHSLQEAGTPTAVATSTRGPAAKSKLRLSKLDHYFQCVLSGDMVERSKPAPDIYLAAAKAIGHAPTDCIALEDSHAGVRAAQAAGMHTIMIPDLLPATNEMRELAHAIFETVSDAHEHVHEQLGRLPLVT